MSTGLPILLSSFSAIMPATSILVAVRHFWKLERELDEQVARVLSESPADPEGKPTGTGDDTEGSV